jgi:FKBP-type peptidyl-prolyl cis-trans isomerase
MTWNGADGKKEEFASTRRGGCEPMHFVLDGSTGTKGLNEGLVNLRESDKAVITVAPSMAYGEAGMPPLVKPNQYNVYHVEVIWITSPEAESGSLSSSLSFLPE